MDDATPPPMAWITATSSNSKLVVAKFSWEV